MGYCYYKEVPEANYLNKCPFCNKESKIKQDCFVVTFCKDNGNSRKKKTTKEKSKILKCKLYYCTNCDICFSTAFSQAKIRFDNNGFSFILKNVTKFGLKKFKRDFIDTKVIDYQGYSTPEKEDYDIKHLLSDNAYKLERNFDVSWKTHKNLVTKDKPMLTCPVCHNKTTYDYSSIPLNNSNSLIVPGTYCKNCDVLYVIERESLYNYLKDNKYAKRFKLNGRCYDNYSEVAYNQKLRDMSKKINSFVICISILLKDKREDYFIVNKKEYENQKRNICHYSSPEARELLTALIRKERNKKGILYGDEYKIKCVFPETNVCDIFAPKVINIKRGGGYYSACMRERNSELIDLLIYSPISDCYEIMKSTYNKSEDYCYTDITIFRKFLNAHGNPYYGHLKDNIFFIGKEDHYFNFSDWDMESMLHMWGYNVNSNDNLSAEQRHVLLSELVDLEIMTVEKKIFMLQLFISVHTRDIFAIRKWKSDIDFISKYKVNPKRFLIAN